MQKISKSEVGRRTWSILRLALLWARKGGVFVVKKRLMLDLSHYMKSLRHFHKAGLGSLQYGERQLSFDATRMIHVQMHRPNSMRFRLPHIPCINPHSDDCSDIFDFDDRSSYSYCNARKSFLIRNGEECDDENQDEDDEYGCGCADTEQICEEEGVDLKAEEFIANFYQQLKLQRQISYLQYKKK